MKITMSLTHIFHTLNRRWSSIASLAGFGLLFVWNVNAENLSLEAQENFTKQVKELDVKRASLSIEECKIQGELLDFAKTKSEVGKAQSTSLQNSSAAVKECQIACVVSDRLIDLIVKAGGVVICSSEADNVIIANLSASSVNTISADKDVWNIFAVEQPIVNGNVSEGVVAHKINSARSSYGVTGKSVKVGVISDSADTYGQYGNYTGLVKKLQNSGDLPQNVFVVGDTYGTGEGSGMMEIVYDVAPDAALYFKNGSGSEIGFANDIDVLMQQGCKVIVDDLTLGREAAFEGGAIGRKIKEFVDNGGVYFSSAANSGALDRGSSCTWEGDYRDGSSAPNLDGTFHDFGNGNANRITSAGLGRIRLWWSDPWGKSSNDYDLYVVDANGNILQQSTESQNGNGCYPFESIILNDSAAGKIQVGLYVVIVKKAGAQARYLRLEVTRGRLGVGTCGSTFGHNAGEDVISCAAASASGFTRSFRSTDPIESYSSDGPRHIFYTSTGEAITSGNFLSTGGRSLQKPDFTAADNTLSAWTATAFGQTTFGGTSAAAPHAAAIAALMLEANPNLTQPDIFEILKKSTISGSNSSWNRNSGYGIIDAHTAVQLAKASVGKKISLTPTSQTFTSTANTGTISVEASSSWTVTASASWIQLKTDEGIGNGTISYSIGENTGTQNRLGTIMVISGEDKAMCTITQAAASTRLSITPAIADFSSVAAEGQISVLANYSWTATSPASWITLHTTSGSGNGTVLYSIADNSGTKRTGTITVKSGSLTATHTVTQAAQPQLSISPSSASVSANAANGSFAVSSDSMWTVSKSGTATWVTLKTTSGSGNGTVSYSVDQNTGARRTGYIYVKSGTVTRTYTITQKCANIVTFSASSVVVDSSGGSGTIKASVFSDGNSTIQASGSHTGDWITWTRTDKTITDGYEYTYTWKADANTTAMQREASINIVLNGKTYSCRIVQDPHGDFYRITYRPGTYGTGDEISISKKKGAYVVLKGATYTRSGYTQKGWATSDGGPKAYALMSVYLEDRAITLYPYWEASSSSPTTYTITYSPGRYGSGSIQTAEKLQGTALTLPGVLFARDGYEQAGWSTDWAGTTKTYPLRGAYATDAKATLYPYWEEILDEDEVECDVGFDIRTGWKHPMCLSSTNLAFFAYAPKYVFEQGDGLVLNYLYKNFSDSDADLSDRHVALYDVNDNCVASVLESLTDTIPAGQRMLSPNWQYSEWMKSLSPGNYVMEIHLDPYNKLNDPDDSNNWCDEWFAVKAPGISLNEALDCNSLDFELNGSDTAVFAQTSESVVGGSCLQFGPQSTNTFDTVLWSYMTEPGTLSFKWKASAHDSQGCMVFYVGDDRKKWIWGGSGDWTDVTVEISQSDVADGGCWVSWEFWTYDADSYYLTAGWLDNVVWNPSGRKPTFTVDANGTLTGVELNGVTDLEIPSMVNKTAVRAIGAYVLTNTPITSVSIPSTVVSIERFAFYNNPNLSGVTIPGSVKYIYESAFNACSALKSVVLEEGVEAIGNYAFYNCGQLTTVCIPASVTLIDQSPFGNCPKLRTITVASGNRLYEVRGNALADKRNTLVQYPSGRTESEYTIPDGITGIGYDAFDTVSALSKVRIPASVASLGRFAFYGCGSLETLEFLGNAPTVGDYAFLGVPSSCRVLVSPQSSGWGVSIPGTWNGLSIAYSQELAMYGVSYNPGAYGNGAALTESKPHGVSLPLKGATFTRTGYVQTGWATSDGGAKAYELGASYTANADITLYPFWTAAQYSLSYELDGGTSGTTFPSSATYDVAFAVSAPSRSGYAFSGWLVSGDLDTTTAHYGSSASDLASAIGSDGQLCFNGSDANVWFLNLSSVYGGTVMLTATWEEADDGSRDIGFYAPDRKGWASPLFLNHTNVEFLAYAPETEFEQFSTIYLNFCAVNWSRVGTAILQSTLLTITDEAGNVLEQAEPIQRYTLGAFGYQEFRGIPLHRYIEGLEPGRYRLSAELDPNLFLNDPDRSNNSTSIWFTVTAPSDPIPELPDGASRIAVATALSGSVDGKLSENITDINTYDAYRTWAHAVKDSSGKVAGAAAVKASDKAWFSFAIDSPVLVEKTISRDDVRIEDFAMSANAAQFEFAVRIADIIIGDAATSERLKKIFGLESAESLNNGDFAADNLVIETVKGENGKARIIATPTPPKTGCGATANGFFMRAVVRQ